MRTHLSAALLAAVLALLGARGDALSATAITLPSDFSDELVANVALPTALAFTPDGRMLITTQPGQLRVYEDGALVSTPALSFASGAICTTSERGLLGVEVDPNFSANGWIYLYWSQRINSTTCRNRVSRFTMTGNTVSLASEVALVTNIPAPLGTHNAGDVHIAKDGNLYVSVGDGGSDYAGDSGSGTNNDAARDMHALVGKILRITRDGGIPADNPFTGTGTVRCNTTGTTTAPNKCQEIFSTGLRNPFRIAFDPNAAGVKFHINDVGQNHWEEIDLGTAGADYGWNVREGPCVRGSTTNCGAPPAGMTNPIYAYQQGDPSGCRAITGGAFVPNGIWPPEYTGSYLFADYVCGRIFKLDLVGGNYVRTDFASGLGSNSAVHMRFGPHGATQALYYTTYEDSGSVRRIVHTGAANRVPTAALSASPASGPAPLTVSFDGSGSSDPDPGDSLTYLWDFGDGQTASGSSPTTSHTYSSGTYTASLRVRDDDGATSTAAAVQIQSGNTAPVPVIETPSAAARFRAGDNVVLHGSATDAQDGTLAASRLSWRVLRHHGTSHTHPWLPDTPGNDVSISTPGPEDLATAGTSFLEVRLTATDSQGLSTTVTREFRPRLVDLSFATSPAGFDLEVNGEQVDSPFTLPSWEAWQFPVNAPSQRATSGATWVFDSWSDGGAQTHTITTGTTPVTYTATFRPGPGPVASASSVSTPEDTPRSVTLNASDANGDAIAFAIESSPTMGSLGPLSGANVTYTPTANATGADSFDFSATDGETTSPDTRVSITVTEVNDAPDAVNDTTSVAEDGSVLVDVRANDSKGPANESGQTLTVSSPVGTPAHGTVLVEAGGVRYAPTGNYNGPDSFTYEICDNGTTTGSPAPRCDTATVGVTVTPVNDAPAAADDTATVAPGGSILVDVLANDAPGPPDEAGQALTVSGAGAAAHGSTSIEGNKVRYTPAPGYAGPDTFDYTACDPGALCDSGTVAVTVGNAAPAAANMAAAATEDVQVAIELAATDPNGDALTFQIVAPPAHGTIVSLVGRTARYQPAANYHGADSFTFRASDGTLSSGVATVTVTVHEINDPPLASPDSATLATDGGPLTIDVTGNDAAGPPDEAGQRLILTAVGTPAHGAAAVSGNHVVYTPSRTHNGPDSFTYTVCDDGRSGGTLDPRCASSAVDFAFSAFPLPRNLSAPRILGGARAGTRARAVLGTWDAPLLGTDYAWLRCARSGGACVRIPRAGASEYRTTLADVGRTLRVAVTGHNRFGATTATSAGRMVATPLELAAVRHRGDDWVLLRNRTQAAVPLAGWSLRDATGLVHRFRGGAIGPLRSLRVDTRDVWRAQERATLRLPDGRVADVCAYKARAAVATC